MILKRTDGRQDDLAQIADLARRHPRVRAKAEEEVRKIRSGLHGGGTAAHFIDRAFQDSKKTGVLHDVRLDCGNGDYAQIDHLLIHRVQGSAYIMETKNFRGDLVCDEHGDWTVFDRGRPRQIASPIEQAKRQGVALERWLRKREIKGIHRIVPVVLTNPTSRINRKHLRKDDHVIRSDNFPRWFEDQADGLGVATILGMTARFLMSGLSEDDLRLLGRKIVEAHEPARYDWSARLGVRTEEAAESLRAVPQDVRDIPAEIVTRYGIVRVNRLPDGRCALRHEANDMLAKLVEKTARPGGQWNPRYRNWIVPVDRVPTIVHEIGVA